MKAMYVTKVQTEEQLAQLMKHVDDNESCAFIGIDNILLLALHYQKKVDANLLKEIHRILLKWKGQIALTINGLYKDPREVYEVTEVQDMALTIAQHFPHLITRPNLADETRQWLLCAETLALGGSVNVIRKTGRTRSSLAGEQPEMILLIELPEYPRDGMIAAKKIIEGTNRKAV